MADCGQYGVVETDTITLSEAVTASGRPERSIRRWVSTGLVEGRRTEAGVWLLSSASLREFLAARDAIPSSALLDGTPVTGYEAAS